MSSYDYRRFLKQILKDRKDGNPLYSNRAFARDLGLQSGKLSQIFQNKQGLSQEKAKFIAERLKLNPHESKIFVLSVQAHDGRSKAERQIAQDTLDQIQKEEEPSLHLQDDIFKVISDWYHYAILELTHLSTFRNNPTWIARKLGISKLDAANAVTRLCKLGLLEMRDKKWRSTQTHLFAGGQDTSEYVRKGHKQLLTKALRAVDEQDTKERDLSALTLAIDEASLPEFQEHIKKFRRKFNYRAEELIQAKQANPNKLYCLAIQFFQLTEKEAS